MCFNSMNGTTRIIIPATITEIGDGPYFYAACQECYSKLIESSDAVFMCLKCGRSIPHARVVYRYRLSMTITDSSTYVTVTAFGGILNAYFGCTASEFHQRWMKQLTSLVGSLEQTVSKWAVEESLIGCHMHFGFKIQSSFLHSKKSQGNCGISLKDISEQCSESLYSSRADKSLVALQVISQNNSYLPRPVTFHLQNVISFLSNENVVDDAAESHQIKVYQFIQRHYAQNKRKISDVITSPQDLSFSEESSSLVSSMDQTSINLSCSIPLQSTILTDRCDRSHFSQNVDDSRIKSTMTAAVKPASSSENNQGESSSIFSSSAELFALDSNSTFSQSASDVQQKRGDFEDQNKDHYDSQYSVALFEDSVFSAEEGPEMPMADTNVNCSLISGILSEEVDLLSIVDEDGQNISTDLSCFHTESWKLKENSEISLPQCHSVLQPICDRCVTDKYCETHAQNLECGKSLLTKSVNKRKVCLKSYVKQLDSNIIMNSHNKTSNRSVETCSQFLRNNSKVNSWHPSIHPVMKDSPVDMPESEDIELFLAAANYSADQARLRMTRDVSHLFCQDSDVTKEIDSNIIMNSHNETSKKIFNRSVEMCSQVLSNNLMNSSHPSIHPVMKDSPVDIPESEDLELFLAAANYPADHARMTRDVSHSFCRDSDVSPRQQSEQEKKKNMVSNIGQRFPNPHHTRHTSEIAQTPRQTTRNTISLLLDSEYAGLAKPNFQTNHNTNSSHKGQERKCCEKRNAERSDAFTNSQDRLKTSKLALDLNSFHHETKELQRQIIATEQSNKEKQQKCNTHIPSENEFLEPLTNNFQSINFDFDANLALQSEGPKCFNNFNLGEQRQRNTSSDLFSSDDSFLDTKALHAFKQLSIVDKTVSSSSQNNSSIAVTTGAMPGCKMSNCRDAAAENCYFQSLCSKSQDLSFDLFSTPSSKKTDGDDCEIYFRTSSPRSKLSDNSYDLFSSGDEM